MSKKAKKGRTIALIPARAGSKGIINKNLKVLCGKPLIIWTIEHALEAAIFDDIIVSTDSEEIARVAREGGANVPFLRPDKLSGDLATAHQVVEHAIGKLNLSNNDFIFYLQPTSPLRCVEQMVEAAKLIQNGIKSIASASLLDVHLDNIVTVHDEGLNFILEGGQTFRQRQENPLMYYVNGGYFAFSVDFFQKKNVFFDNTSKLVISSKVEAFDIDDADDWNLVELIMNEREKFD